MVTERKPNMGARGNLPRFHRSAGQPSTKCILLYILVFFLDISCVILKKSRAVIWKAVFPPVAAPAQLTDGKSGNCEMREIPRIHDLSGASQHHYNQCNNNNNSNFIFEDHAIRRNDTRFYESDSQDVGNSSQNGHGELGLGCCLKQYKADHGMSLNDHSHLDSCRGDTRFTSIQYYKEFNGGSITPRGFNRMSVTSCTNVFANQKYCDVTSDISNLHSNFSENGGLFDSRSGSTVSHQSAAKCQQNTQLVRDRIRLCRDCAGDLTIDWDESCDSVHPFPGLRTSTPGQEEKIVAENYADRFVKNSELSPNDVERLLQDHALSMQALRKRQEGERESIKERMRIKLRNRLKGDKYNGGESEQDDEMQGSSTPTAAPRPVPKPRSFASEDVDSDSTKNSQEQTPNDKPRPISMYGNCEDSEDSDTEGVLADTIWNTMNLKRRMTAEHMQDMVKRAYEDDTRGTNTDIPEEPETPDRVFSKGTGTSGDEQDLTKADLDFTSQLLKQNRVQMSDAEFAAFLDDYLHDRDSLKKYRARQKAEWDEKLNKRLLAKKTGGPGGQEQAGTESDDGGYVEDFETDSQKSETDSMTSSQEELDETTLQELKALKADLRKQMGQNRQDLNEDDIKKMLALYRQKQAEIIATRKASREKHDDKLKERLKQRSNQNGTASQLEPGSEDDEHFFERLMQRQERGELSKEQFSVMLKEYLNKKKEAERKRKKSARNRDNEVDKMAAVEMVSNFQKDKQQLHNVRKAERTKIDEKLQRKLLSKRNKKGATTDLDELNNTDGDSTFNDSSLLNESS